jgi:hypothetical protein
MSRPTTLTLTLSLTLTLIALVLPVPASAAVTVTSFTAGWQGNQVVLNWRTATELNNRGFNIFRSTSPSGSFQKINGTEIPAQMGAALIGASYSYVDPAVTSGQTYYYKLQSVENNGNTIFYDGIASTASQTQATATRTATKPPASATATLQATATRTPTVVGSATPAATPSRTATVAPNATIAPATPTPLRTKVALVPTIAPSGSNSSAASQQSIVEPTATPQVAVAIKESIPDESVQQENVESEEPAQSDRRIVQLVRVSITLIAVFVAFIGLIFLLGAAYFFARNYSR